MDDRTEESSNVDEIVGIKIHAAAITKALWAIATTLVGAFVIAGVTFAFSVNSNCVEFRAKLDGLEQRFRHLNDELAGVQRAVGDYPPAKELNGLRRDVSELQFSSSASLQVLNELTRTVRELHPWPVPPRNAPPPAPAP